MPQLLAVLALAGPVASSPQTLPATGPALVPFNATLRATTHRPVATRPWRYVVRVTNRAGRPIRAQARFQIVFSGQTPPPPRELGRRTFRGTYEGIYRWLRAMRGAPLVFRATIVAQGATRRLAYWIRVR